MRLRQTDPSRQAPSPASSEARASLGPAQEAPRVPFLDGVRGLAILLVLLHHGNEVDEITRFDHWLMNFTQSAWTGVDLFFVLSGFLITGILLDTKKSGNYFKSFYARRSVRIFPLYYLTIFIYFYVFQPVFRPDDADVLALKDDQIWFWTYLSNVQTAMHGTWPRAQHLMHLWSVSIEEQFYIVWPAVVLLMNRQRLKFVCLCCICASFSLRVILMLSHGGPVPTYVSTATRLDGLALGALIAAMIREPGEIDLLVRNIRIAGSIGLAFILGMFVFHGGLNMNSIVDNPDSLTPYSFTVMTFGLLAVALFFSWFLVMGLVAPPRSLLVRFLSSRVLRMFGKYSYCMYLWHMPVQFFLLGTVGVWPRKFPTLFGSQLPGQLVLYACLIGVTLVCAMISWQLFEKQFLKLKRFFPYGTVVEPGRTPDRNVASGVKRNDVVMAHIGKS